MKSSGQRPPRRVGLRAQHQSSISSCLGQVGVRSNRAFTDMAVSHRSAESWVCGARCQMLWGT